MREEYEQLELDTRRQLDKAIAQLTEDTVKTAGEMILSLIHISEPTRRS